MNERAGRKFRGKKIKTTECYRLATIGLIVAPLKFDVLILKLAYLPSKRNNCFKNIKLPRGNFQPIVPRQKHYCLHGVRPWKMPGWIVPVREMFCKQTAILVGSLPGFISLIIFSEFLVWFCFI